MLQLPFKHHLDHILSWHYDFTLDTLPLSVLFSGHVCTYTSCAWSASVSSGSGTDAPVVVEEWGWCGGGGTRVQSGPTCSDDRLVTRKRVAIPATSISRVLPSLQESHRRRSFVSSRSRTSIFESFSSLASTRGLTIIFSRESAFARVTPTLGCILKVKELWKNALRKRFPF